MTAVSAMTVMCLHDCPECLLMAYEHDQCVSDCK